MCLILFAFQSHPRYHLIVAANRDEFFRRPAAPASWWGKNSAVLGGRDMEAGGTWLGMTHTGRFAALTNYRDPPAHRSDAPSRGALVSGFLESDESPVSYMDGLVSRADTYNGFNLLVADHDVMLGFCNRKTGVQPLTSGIHGVSNGLLDEPWPKVTRGCASLSEIIASDEEPDLEALFSLLADRNQTTDAELPDTGVGIEWERLLSARFIAAPGYGTRCSTVLLWSVDGNVKFVERSFDEQGEELGTVVFSFRLQE